MSEELLKQADELRRRGESERRRPGTDGGVAAYEHAVALLRTTGDVLKLAHTIRHLGDVHQEQGRPELAAPHYDEALALYRAHPNPPPGGLANAIRSQAVLKGGNRRERRGRGAVGGGEGAVRGAGYRGGGGGGEAEGGAA